MSLLCGYFSQRFFKRSSKILMTTISSTLHFFDDVMYTFSIFFISTVWSSWPFVLCPPVYWYIWWTKVFYWIFYWSNNQFDAEQKKGTLIIFTQLRYSSRYKCSPNQDSSTPCGSFSLVLDHDTVFKFSFAKRFTQFWWWWCIFFFTKDIFPHIIPVTDAHDDYLHF